MSFSNKLIYGKAGIRNIVSIEPQDDKVILFIQQPDGTVKREIKPHRYWILSAWGLGDTVKLAGDLHYQHGIQFETKEDWNRLAYQKQNKDLYLIYNDKEACQVKDGYAYFLGLNPGDISILSFDIETNGLKHNDDSIVYLISNTYRQNGQITKKLFSLDEYDNCDQMIKAWTRWVRLMDPSILCGHNIEGYDLPYLSHVAGMCGQELLLGRNNSAIEYQKNESKFRVDGTRDLHYHRAKIFGREIVDTIFLSYKYDIGRKYESYGLKYIINAEGLEQKDRIFYDAGTIKDNWNNLEERTKIKAYCISDADDSLALYDLMIPPFFYMTQMVPKPLQLMIESASGSQLNSILVRSYLQDKHSIPKADESVEFEGSISLGIPGIYKNCFKIDVASLFPSIQLEYQIYPQHKDPNGYLMQLLDYLRTERLKNKTLAKDTGEIYYEHLQSSMKISINSMYGFMGAKGLNFNYPEGAAAITRHGREIISKTIEWATNKKLDYWMGLINDT